MGVELGIWQGRYQNLELPWLRWWTNGNLLQTGWERSHAGGLILVSNDYDLLRVKGLSLKNKLSTDS